MSSIAPEARTVEMPLDPAIRRAVAADGLQLCATDAHRLTLQAKLTELGVPPSPADRGALRQLATLDTESVDAVVRWLSHAAGVPRGVAGAFIAAPPLSVQPLPAQPRSAEAALRETPLGETPPCAHTRIGTVPETTTADPGTAGDTVPETPAPTHPADRMDPRLVAW